MLKYSLRNVAYYRKKYMTAFALVLVFSFSVALSLFCFAGFWKRAQEYARNWGDIAFGFDIVEVDKDSYDAEPGGRPSEKLYRDSKAFIEKELKPTKYRESASVYGTVYGSSSNSEIRVNSIETQRLFAPVDLLEGSEPEEGEILLPSTMRKSFPLGGAVTFVYKNADLILNSLQFRISGFFIPTDSMYPEMLVSPSQFDEIFGRSISNVFYVWLPEVKPEKPFLTEFEYNQIFQKYRSAAIKSLNDWSPPVGYSTAKGRYKSIADIIGFFQIIIIVFLFALVVIAVMTIINVLVITVADRIKIVGTFMAFGMSRGRAVLLLAVEMLAFSLAACALGSLAAYAASSWISGIKIMAENSILVSLLGGRRSLTVLPNWPAVGATFAAGTLIPFAAAILTIRKQLKGEIVRLLYFVR